MGALLDPFGPSPPPPPAPPAKLEGAFKNVETLAVFLCWANEVEHPVDRLDILDLWESKREGVREGYRIKAKRILKAWST